MLKTYFIDIDGTILEHCESAHTIIRKGYLKPNPDAVEKISKWHHEDHRIILTTARPEMMRDLTERQLLEAGIIYDFLLMGLPHGQRILINDTKPEYDMPMALAYSLRRDEGLGQVE